MTTAAPRITGQCKPFPATFTLTWDDGNGGTRTSTATESDVSRMIDMADCDQADGLVRIEAPGRGGKLREVRVGKTSQINRDQEYPLYYGQAPLITEDGLLVGYVTFTDH